MGLSKKDIDSIADSVAKKLADKWDFPGIIANNQGNNDELLSLKQAAIRLNMSHHRLYKLKDQIGGWTKVNGRIKFSRNKIEEHIRQILSCS